MTTLSDLIAAATVGTAHRPVDLAALPADLRPEPLPTDPAAALLDAAALSTVARRTVAATREAVPGVPILTVPIPTVTEHLPVAPQVVQQILSRVANQPAILIEALTLIHRAGFRLPPAAVPGLLDDSRSDVVAATRPVAGEIGRLLMTKNPRWAAPATTDPADRTDWDEGTSAQRTSWLRALRRIDTTAARELLAATFSQDSAANRAELVAVLIEGLSVDDQEFLLTAAADRSRAVVTAANSLLTLLPDAPLRRDMRALAARHLTLARRLLRTTVAVTEPRREEFAPWTVQESDPWTTLLGRTDPAEWPQIFGGDLVRLIAGGSVELQPLLPGFRAAAITFRHAPLAAVLVAATLTRGDRKNPPSVQQELWAVLEPSDATTLLDRLLGHPSVRADQVAAAITGLATPWPVAVARRYARWLPSGGSAGAPAPRPAWDLLATATGLPDCRELAELVRSLTPNAAGDQGPALTTRASSAANLLTLRAVLYETLSVPGGNP